MRDPDRRYKLYAALATLLGLLVAVLYGVMVAPKGGRLAGGVATLFCAIAPFTLGGLVGFLFGIPKTVAPSEDGQNGIHRSWHPNTSLEQISDWLTKILLGIGLTQLTVIPGELQET